MMTPDSPQSFKTIGRLGRVLWRDPAQADSIVLDAFSTVSLLDLPEEESSGNTEERVAAILLERARKTSTAVSRLKEAEKAPPKNRPFYSLFPDERFLLIALHLEDWTYARVGKVLGVSAAEVEEMAWRIRIQVSGRYPHGGTLETPNCPEYDLRRPWTQRFLDEEFSGGSDRFFLQNHLMACAGCRRTLASCRELYYAVDGILPRDGSTEAELVGLLRGLKRIDREKDAYLRRTLHGDTGYSEFWRLLRRPDMVLLFLGMALLLMATLGKRPLNNRAMAERTASQSFAPPEP